ncbi:MAG: hypothetical protein M0P39_14960, partial [Rhodocyclaceae bacterium]|nr:hypothetical protein [Rhodocyclaceae bacterium]
TEKTYYDAEGEKLGSSYTNTNTWTDWQNNEITSTNTSYNDADGNWLGREWSDTAGNEGWETRTVEEVTTFDFNGDGAVDSADAMTVQVERGSNTWTNNGQSETSEFTRYYANDNSWTFLGGTETRNGETTTYDANWNEIVDLTGLSVLTEADGTAFQLFGAALYKTKVWDANSSETTYYNAATGEKIGSGYAYAWPDGEGLSYNDANGNLLRSEWSDSNGNNGWNTRTVEDITFDFDGNPDTPDTTQEVKVERGGNTWNTETSSFEHYYVNDNTGTHLGGQDTHNGVTTKYDAGWNPIGGGGTGSNTFDVTLDSTPDDGDTLIGSFNPWQGTKVELHDANHDGTIDQLIMSGSSTDTFHVDWSGTDWTGHRTETLTFGTDYDANGRPRSVVDDDGSQPIPITWLSVPISVEGGMIIGTLSFDETQDGGLTHHLDISLIDTTGDGMTPDRIQTVTDSGTASSQTEVLTITDWTNGPSGPTSMTIQVVSDTSGEGIIHGSATFDTVSGQIDTVTLPLPEAGGGGTSTGTGDTTAPTLISATVPAEGMPRVVLSFDDPLDTAVTPLSSSFTVNVAGSPVEVSSVTVIGGQTSGTTPTGGKVILMLSNAVPAGATVTVTYTDPSSSADGTQDLIQNTAGLDAASIVSYTVTNNSTATGGGGGTDTTAPVLERASFAEDGTNTVTLVFSEAIVEPLGQFVSLRLFKNLDTSGNWDDFTISVSAINGWGSNTLTLTASTSPALSAADVVLLQYWGDNWGGAMLADAAGNLLEAGEVWMGGSANNAIDLSNYGSWLPITLRGSAGDDTLIGTEASDLLVDGIGADRLVGGGGEDGFVLVEDGIVRPYSRDVVQITPNDDGMSGGGGLAHMVMGTTDAGSGFDILSANPDALSLPSNVIAADAASVSGTNGFGWASVVGYDIADGIVSFRTASGTVTVSGQANVESAVAYLMQNIVDPGTTVAFKFDGDNNGTVESLLVFQDGGTLATQGGSAATDTVVVLENLNGIGSAVLGNTAGVGVVQLVDEQGPEVVAMEISGNIMTLDFTEAVSVPDSVAFTISKNGTAPVAFTNISGEGTNSLTLTMNTSFTDTDWWMGSYTATGSANGFFDAAGNAMLGEDGEGFWVDGNDGNNSIDLSNSSVFTQLGYDVMAYGGNDTVIGTALTDWIEAGTGADTLTGGAGADEYGFVQGDSPTLTFVESSGGTPFLDFGDTFVFGGGADIITDFSAGDSLNLQTDQAGVPGIGMMNGDPNMLYKPDNGLATDQGFFMIRGNYSNGTFSVDGSTNGHDTLVVYDGDSAANTVVQTGLVLSGVGDWWNQLEYSIGSNYIAHV